MVMQGADEGAIESSVTDHSRPSHIFKVSWDPLTREPKGTTFVPASIADELRSTQVAVKPSNCRDSKSALENEPSAAAMSSTSTVSGSEVRYRSMQARSAISRL